MLWACMFDPSQYSTVYYISKRTRNVLPILCHVPDMTWPPGGSVSSSWPRAQGGGGPCLIPGALLDRPVTRWLRSSHRPECGLLLIVFWSSSTIDAWFSGLVLLRK